MIERSSLFDKRLVVIAGKGGVGRTTVAAALAMAAARRGRTVLLAQTKSKERLSHLFGVPSVGAELVRVRERLWAVNMTPAVALREYGTMVLRSQFIAKQVLENRVSRAFLHAVPGLEDYSMLGKVWYHTTEENEAGRPKWDLVILDGPATGHLITMLMIPQAIMDAVPEGPLTRPGQATLSLLRDPVRTSMVIVTLAEDLPSNEAIELARRARERVKMPLGPLVVNLLYPPRFTQGPSGRALHALPEEVADPPLQPLLARARTAQRRRELNDRYLERLARDLPQPQIHLPYLFMDDFGPAAVEELSRRLEGQVLALAEEPSARTLPGTR
jgi:anion-transporting  ArsA/GET3 family ATPase